MKVLIGARPSNLALKQVDEVVGLLAKAGIELDYSIVKVSTNGDIDKKMPISQIEGSDFFTREIEQCLLEGKIDVAVHSAKDLEEVMPQHLTIAAITVSLSPYECLVSRQGKKLNELPLGAKVGTSSSKRKKALLRYRSDIKVCDIRGTIEERLEQLDKKRFDAIITAHAALLRLGYEDRITEIISPTIIEPHPLQGSLAIQVRSTDKQLIELFSILNTYKTEVTHEN